MIDPENRQDRTQVRTQVSATQPVDEHMLAAVRLSEDLREAFLCQKHVRQTRHDQHALTGQKSAGDELHRRQVRTARIRNPRSGDVRQALIQLPEMDLFGTAGSIGNVSRSESKPESIPDATPDSKKIGHAICSHLLASLREQMSGEQMSGEEIAGEEIAGKQIAVNQTQPARQQPARDYTESSQEQLTLL